MTDFEFSERLLQRAREVLSRRAGRALEPREVAEALRSAGGVYRDACTHIWTLATNPEGFVEAALRACDRLRVLYDESDRWLCLALTESNEMARVGIAIAQVGTGLGGIRLKAAQGGRP